MMGDSNLARVELFEAQVCLCDAVVMTRHAKSVTAAL